jgi:hypothetical protein
MRTFSVLFFGLIVISSCRNSATVKTDSKEVKQFNVEQLLANTSELVDKEIIVTGTVSHVCKMDGKKMFLFGNNPDSTVKITTGSNLASFDVALEGSEVIIHGIVKELRIDDAYIAQMESDLAKGNREKEPAGQEKAVGENQNEELSNINELKEQIKSSGKGYISEFWVEQISMNKKDSIK